MRENEMPITTLSSREFNQDTSGAKKAASRGPVFITDRGKPAHVLMSMADYVRLLGQTPRITDLLAMPDAADLEFDPAADSIGSRPADLS